MPEVFSPLFEMGICCKVGIEKNSVMTWATWTVLVDIAMPLANLAIIIWLAYSVVVLHVKIDELEDRGNG